MIKIKERPVFRITLSAMCLAIYVVLSSFCPETLFLKITFDSIPLIFISIVAGPIDGVIVAILGCIINDAISGYLTFLTPVWMLPAISRALIIGLIFYKKDILKHKILWVFTVILTGLIVTGINTGAMFLDGYVFGYSANVTIALLGIRIASGFIISIINIFLIPLLVETIRKAGYIEEKEKTVE